MTLALGHGAIDELIAELSEDIAKWPTDAALHFRLAEANCQHEDWAAASRALAKAEELAPGEFPAADLVRGRIMLGARNEDLAKAAFDRFLEAHPGHVQALVFRARALHRMERDEESLVDYRAAIAATKNPEPDLFQETAEELAICGRMDEAVRLLGDGIAKLGPVPSLVLKAMSLEISTGRFDAALSRVDAMRKSAPRPEPWMAKRAEIFEKAGRAAEARAAWESLRSRLAALPNLERGSHAMSVIAEQTEKALQSLASNQPTATPRP